MELPLFPVISSFRLRSSIIFPYSYAVEERRLPAPGGSHDGDHLAAGYREIHPSQGMNAHPACRILLLDTARLYHGPVGSLLSRHPLTCLPDQNSLLPSILAVRRCSSCWRRPLR